MVRSKKLIRSLLLAFLLLVVTGCQSSATNPIAPKQPNRNTSELYPAASKKTYPVKIIAEKSSYGARKGDTLSVKVKTTGNTPLQPLLGVKLVLSDIPAYLQNPKFTISNQVTNHLLRDLGQGQIVLLLTGMRIESEAELGTLTFTVAEDVTPSTISLFYDKNPASLKVSEISGTDGVSKTAYVTYPLSSGPFFEIETR